MQVKIGKTVDQEAGNAHHAGKPQPLPNAGPARSLGPQGLPQAGQHRSAQQGEADKTEAGSDFQVIVVCVFAQSRKGIMRLISKAGDLDPRLRQNLVQS